MQRQTEQLFGTVAAHLFNATGKMKTPVTWEDIFPDSTYEKAIQSGEAIKLAASLWHEAFSGLGLTSSMASGLKDLSERDKKLRMWEPGTPFPN